MEPGVRVSKFRISADGETSSSNENCDETLPEIEAKFSGRNVLIKIHSKKQKGLTAKVLSEIEKLHLTNVSSSVLPFGNHFLDITVVAQMDDEFSMPVKDLERDLRLTLL